MAKTQHLIRDFIQNIESHPNGEQIIKVIENIMATDYVNIDPFLLRSFCKYSGDNLDILTEFCFLRASILNEEGRKKEALQVFLEAVSYDLNDLKIWYRVIEMYLREGALLYAFFFLQEAKNKHLNVSEDFLGISIHLEKQLKLPIGFPDSKPTNNNHEQLQQSNDEVPPNIKNEVIEASSKIFTISDNIRDLWETAIDFYTDGCSIKNSSHLSPFIHYAHSTIKDILGLGGSFKDELEQKVSQYGFFEYQSFFIRLNNLRNRVIHQNYLLTLDEAKEIFEQVQKFLITYTEY